MNVFCFLLALLVIVLAGCTPASVSLNADFGFASDALNKSPDDTKSPSLLTVENAPDHINNANRSSVLLDGHCENVEKVNVKINDAIVSHFYCSDSQWRADLDLSNTTDGTVSIELIDDKSNETLKKVTLEKDTLAPSAIMLSPPPSINNWDFLPIGFDETSGLSQFSYKLGYANTTDCTSPADYSSYMSYSVGVAINLTFSTNAELRVCLIGKDLFGNEQPYSLATRIDWRRDAVAPTLTLTTSTHTTYSNAGNYRAFQVQVTCSESGRPVTVKARSFNGGELSGSSNCASGSVSKSTDLATLPDGNVEFLASQSDEAGNVTEVSLLTITKDISPPVFSSGGNIINDGDFSASALSTPAISWLAATDDISGVHYYSLGVGTTPDLPNILAFSDPIYTTSYSSSSPTGIFAADTRFYTILKVFDRAGNSGRISSDGWVTDFTGPSIASIDDGTVSSVGKSPLITWPTGTDGSGSGINSYFIAIGSTPGNSDIVNWTDVDLLREFQTTHPGLQLGQVYYASVKAQDNVGNFGTPITGNGFKIRNLISSVVTANDGAFAAVLETGKVIVWGDEAFGGNYSNLPSLLKYGVVRTTSISKTYNAFAALQEDGSVISWGDAVRGGNMGGTVMNDLNGSIDATSIFSNKYAFAAIRSDGSVITWGDSARGGNSSAVFSGWMFGAPGAIEIKSTSAAFAALMSDGSVVAWGDSSAGGTIPTPLVAELDGTPRVTRLFSTGTSFIALRVDGSLVSWGDSIFESWFAGVQSEFVGTIAVVDVITNSNAAAALRADGSVVTWGDSNYGGDSSSVSSLLSGTIPVTTLVASGKAFAAIRSNHSVVTWGNSANGGTVSSPIIPSLNVSGNQVVNIYSTFAAFAAVRLDGSVVTWGDASYGGNSSSVAAQINGSTPVTSIFSTNSAFAALRNNGSVVKWGDSTNGGDPFEQSTLLTGSPVKVLQIYSNKYSFTARREDGTFVTWGSNTFGGDSSTINP